MIGTREAQPNNAKDAYLTQWRAILVDPNLKDLPFKVETNACGKIVLSPATKLHHRHANEIFRLLERFLEGGESFTESPVLTRKGIRSPDAGWASMEHVLDGDEVYVHAPEICVEVISPSNTSDEIDEKTDLYFDAGALEVWTCDLRGNMKFSDPDGVLEQSKLASTFPSRVELKS